MSDPVTKIRELIACIAEQKDINGEATRVDRLISDHEEQVRQLKILRQLLKPSSPPQPVYTVPPYVPPYPYQPTVVSTECLRVITAINTFGIQTLPRSPSMWFNYGTQVNS